VITATPAHEGAKEGARTLCPLKMAGGKRQLLPDLLRHVPERFGRYVEPFVGGGALFFELAHRITTAALGDTNERLVRTYAALREDVSGVVRLLRGYPTSAASTRRCGA